MSKKRQNGNAKKKFDEVKKIAGKIPETTRSENPFKRHPTTHQTKCALTILWLSWNKVMKQKSKNNKIKSVNILKIWSIFVINWDPEKNCLRQK